MKLRTYRMGELWLGRVDRVAIVGRAIVGRRDGSFCLESGIAGGLNPLGEVRW